MLSVKSWGPAELGLCAAPLCSVLPKVNKRPFWIGIRISKAKSMGLNKRLVKPYRNQAHNNKRLPAPTSDFAVKGRNCRGGEMHQVIYEQIHKVRPVHSKSESPQSGEG